MNQQCFNIDQAVFTATKQQLNDEKQLAILSKALSHSARLRILSILLAVDKSGGCLNSDLVSELGLAQSTVSEHLRILKTAELITAEPMPPKMCYRINRDTLTTFSGLFLALYS